MSKLADERTRKQLLEIAAMPGNDTCADCKSRAPRWASHNLGIFICVHCATVHRKIGTHVTKVKSLTLDSWTKDQVEVMRQNGNLKSNAFFNPNESRNPPPTNLEESERDGELEKYIRSKYEYRRFVDRTPRQPQQPQNQPQLPPRAQSTPLTNQQPPPAAPVQRPPSAMPAPAQPVFGNNSTLQYRPSTTSVPQAQAQSAVTPAPAPAAPPKPSGGVWDDILAIQSGPAPPTVNSLGGNPYANSTQANSTFAQLSQPGAPAFNSQQGAFSPSPAQFGQSQPTGAFPGMTSMTQPSLSGANPPTRSFTMPAAMPSTSMPAMSPQFQAMAPQATSSPGNPFFNNMQQPQQFTPSPLTSPPLNTYAQQPQSFAQQAFQQQQQQQQPQSFSQPFQQAQQPSAFQASPPFFQQAQQVQQQSAFGQQQAAFGQQPQTAFTPQQQQPAFNLQNFMPQSQQQQMQPSQTNPFSPGWPGQQQQQQQPQQQFPGAFGQQQMYSQPGWPSS